MNDVFKKLIIVLAFVTILVLSIVMNWTGVLWLFLGSMWVLAYLQETKYRRNLIIISIFGFLLGWRGLGLSPSFYIYPTELFFWMAFAISLTEHQKKVGREHFGFIEIALLALSLQGIITALFYDRNWASVLSVFKSFIVFIPILFVLRRWVHNTSQLYLYSRSVVYVGIIIAVSGLVERFVPSAYSFLPEEYQISLIRYNFEFGSEVELSGFRLWGTPVVSVLLVLCAGMAAFLPPSPKGAYRYLDLLALPIITLGIIASGYRSAWLGLAVVLALLLFFLPRRGIVVLTISAIPAILLFPISYLDRLRTVFYLTHAQDPTFITRSNALQTGLRTLQTHFFLGTGWSSPTAFNDWVNVGVFIGGIGLLVFVAWYIRILSGLSRLTFRREFEQRNLALAYLASLTGNAISMVSGAMSQVFPIMTAFWLVFCLACRFIEISRTGEKRA